MINFSLPLAVATALILGTAQASPLANGNPGNEPGAEGANVNCHSNNAVLKALRDPTVSDEARTFCSEFIRSTATAATTVTTTDTSFVATQTITPSPVVTTETRLTYITVFSTVSGAAKPSALGRRQAKGQEGGPLPSYVSKFDEDRVSRACSCIFTPNTTTLTPIATQTVPGTITTTLEASTTTVTAYSSTVACRVQVPVVLNGGFEDGDGPWTYGANTAADDALRTTEARTGEYGLVSWCNHTALGFTDPPIISQPISLCSYSVYNISFWYKFIPPTTGSVPGGSIFAQIGGRAVGAVYREEPMDQWRQFQRTFRAIQDAEDTTLSFQPNCGPFPNNPVVVDDVSIDYVCSNCVIEEV